MSVDGSNNRKETVHDALQRAYFSSKSLEEKHGLPVEDQAFLRRKREEVGNGVNNLMMRYLEEVVRAGDALLGENSYVNNEMQSRVVERYSSALYYQNVVSMKIVKDAILNRYASARDAYLENRDLTVPERTFLLGVQGDVLLARESFDKGSFSWMSTLNRGVEEVKKKQKSSSNGVSRAPAITQDSYNVELVGDCELREDSNSWESR